MNGFVRAVAITAMVLVCLVIVCRLIGANMVRNVRASAIGGKLALTSPAFGDDGDLPAKYAGRCASPPLNWSEPPTGTKSLALVAVDESNPLGLPITHWTIFNIPASLRGLAEGVPQQARLADGTVQGWNWSRRNAYIGPEPPWGRHLYSFTLYALDAELDLEPTTVRPALMRAMKGHVLASARLVGYYSHR